MITKGKMPWSFIKFSQVILKGNVWRSVWRICMWILELKGLRKVWNSKTVFSSWPHDWQLRYLLTDRAYFVPLFLATVTIFVVILILIFIVFFAFTFVPFRIICVTSCSVSERARPVTRPTRPVTEPTRPVTETSRNIIVVIVIITNFIPMARIGVVTS